MRAFESLEFILNMGLWPNFSRIYFFQMFVWIPLVLSPFLYFTQERPYLSGTDLFVAYLTTGVRCIVIGIRYATIQESRFFAQSERVFSREESNKDFVIGTWENMHPNDFDIEVKHSMIRNEIENDHFSFRFLMKINDEYKERFTNFNYYNENVHDMEKDREIQLTLIKIIREA